MSIFSCFKTASQMANCRRCEYAQVGSGYYGWLDYNLLTCRGFGSNQKSQATSTEEQLYTVQVGSEMGQTTKAEYPYAMTINEKGDCPRYKPASLFETIIRSFAQPIPR